MEAARHCKGKSFPHWINLKGLKCKCLVIHDHHNWYSPERRDPLTVCCPNPAGARSRAYKSFPYTSHPWTVRGIPGPTLGYPQSTFKSIVFLWQITMPPVALQPTCSVSVPASGPDEAGFSMTSPLKAEDAYTAIWPNHKKQDFSRTPAGFLIPRHDSIFSLVFCHVSYFAPTIQVLVLLIVPSTEDELQFLHMSCSFTLGGIYSAVPTSRTLSDHFLPCIWKSNVWLRTWLWNKTRWLWNWLFLLSNFLTSDDVLSCSNLNFLICKMSVMILFTS